MTRRKASQSVEHCCAYCCDALRCANTPMRRFVSGALGGPSFVLSPHVYNMCTLYTTCAQCLQTTPGRTYACAVSTDCPHHGHLQALVHTCSWPVIRADRRRHALNGALFYEISKESASPVHLLLTRPINVRSCAPLWRGVPRLTRRTASRSPIGVRPPPRWAVCVVLRTVYGVHAAWRRTRRRSTTRRTVSEYDAS